MAKNLLLGLILARVGSKVGSPIFFKKIWLRQSLNMASYHHVQYQKKLIMIKSCENLVTDWWTERRTDEQKHRRTRVISQDVVQLTSSIQ